MADPTSAVRNTDEADAPPFEPRTPLGKRLWEMRQEIIRSGAPLLDWDALHRELADRR